MKWRIADGPAGGAEGKVGTIGKALVCLWVRSFPRGFHSWNDKCNTIHLVGKAR
jgi:hypothetical protein